MIQFQKLSMLQTGMFGAMLGDALGVPHEFKMPHAINKEYVENPLAISEDYKTWDVPLGVYSDDFSQMLCVFYNCVDNLKAIHMFYEDLLLWQRGKYWVNAHKFDEGMQTQSQLEYYRRKKEVRMHDEHMCGNGSLMRILPVAFFTDDINDLKVLTWQYSAITHNSDETVKACQFYTILARLVADANLPGKDHRGVEFLKLWDKTIDLMGWDPDRAEDDFGSGYVIDTLNMVWACIGTTNSYAEAVKRAILYGGDTDTNACVVGGIAALVYGLNDVPEQWLEFIKPSLTNRYVMEVFASGLNG